MLVIYAHPNKDGHCGEILRQIIAGLENKKTPYTLLDLYEMNYDPILHANEHSYSKHYEVSSETLRLQELFKNNDRFIFIYPTWWQSVPAILKGFFDKVFTPKFAFKYVNKFPKGLLRGKAAVISTSGGPIFYIKFFVGDKAIRVVTKNILGFCGIKAKGFHLGNAIKFDDSKKKPISAIVRKVLKFVENK